MSTPNFRRGAPAEKQHGFPPKGDGSWLAKYDGQCNYCGARLSAEEDRVRWNIDSTAVICAHHRP